MKVFLDTNVLFLGARGLSEKAGQLLMRADLHFVTSEYVRLEVLPKPVFFQYRAEIATYERFFARATLVPSTQELRDLAQKEAQRWGLGGMDALHIAAASLGGAACFITGEKESKPLYRSTLLPVAHFTQFDAKLLR